MVHVLPQDFYGRLGTIVLLLGHVQIIDENHTFLTHRRTVVASSTLVHLRVDSILSLVSRSLGRKGNGDVLIIVPHLIYLGVYVHGLSRAGGSGTQDVVRLLYKHFSQ